MSAGPTPSTAGRVAWLDAPAGIAGDMLLGALVDAGLPLQTLHGVVEALRLPGVTVRAARVRRGALAATKVDVLVDGVVAELPADDGPGGASRPAHAHGHGHAHAHEHAHEPVAVHGGAGGHARPHAHGPEHRSLAEVLGLLEGARGLPPAALADARRVFGELARAEGRVHGVSAEEVRFHEVGALDALVDVVGACVGLRALGVGEVRVSPLPWPLAGAVATAHGLLPLPPPAVAHLLVGHPTTPSPERFEQVTPTGAALVKALSAGASIPVGFVPRVVGVGAGGRDAGRLPNVLRLVIGDRGPPDEALEAVLLETNLDDVTGQALGVALERALARGALDAWIVPVLMKKGRPGHVLSVLARPEDAAALEALLFESTPTLGVRRRAVARTALARHHVEVPTPYGSVRLKVRSTPAGPEATPEHDDCRRLAEAHGVPLSHVEEAARRAWVR